MTGIVVSNSILIVEFAGTLHSQACLSWKRSAIVQDSFETHLMIRWQLYWEYPHGLGMEQHEQYAPLARAVIGGLAVSVVVTMF